MKAYLDLAQRIITEGKWVTNHRTNTRCLTVINADLVYDVQNGEFPMVTTRKTFYKAAIAELLGYIRGYDNAAQFRKIGTKSWDKNANENVAWLNNPNRTGEDDLGLIYGAIGRNYPKVNGGKVDLLKQIVDDLKNGIDNRAEIYTFYHPGAFELGCLKPCLYSHHFSLLDGVLYLNSTQRSADVPIGLVWNMIQCYTLLSLIAQITNLKPGLAFHKIVNAHIYEDQLELMQQQIQREPFKSPKLIIDPKIKTLEDLETWVTVDHFTVENYQHYPAIQYPFTV